MWGRSPRGSESERMKSGERGGGYKELMRGGNYKVFTREKLEIALNLAHACKWKMVSKEARR